jgi:2'-5' RNA ligase
VATRLAVIAYPTLNEPDRARIQAVRSKHDPQCGLLDPHFTLAFPVEAPLADVVAEATSTAAATPIFPFLLTSVTAVRDAFGHGGHVFLTPDQGAAQVVTIHSLLYGGTLKWAHRPDIPYVPHITIAADADFRRCEALAEKLAQESIAIRGVVTALTVVRVRGGAVLPVATLPLSPLS